MKAFALILAVVGVPFFIIGMSLAPLWVRYAATGVCLWVLVGLIMSVSSEETERN